MRVSLVKDDLIKSANSETDHESCDCTKNCEADAKNNRVTHGTDNTN